MFYSLASKDEIFSEEPVDDEQSHRTRFKVTDDFSSEFFFPTRQSLQLFLTNRF